MTKSEVFALAHEINSRLGREVIPSAILPDENWEFGITPSAELAEGQSDPFWFGFDDILCSRIMDYNRKTLSEIADWCESGCLLEKLGIAESDPMVERYGLKNAGQTLTHIEWLFDKFRKNVFKRVQAPPVLMLSKSAFGFDYRESILGSCYL
jgi:NAD+ synthase (glutamine-hydrolysing)